MKKKPPNRAAAPACGPQYQMSPIGVIRSCYGQKFGIPRQAGLVPSARAEIEIFPPLNRPEAFDGLASFSHIWVLFLFHAHAQRGWSARVRPPRLGGNRSVGLFASRTAFRPNPIGLSAVELLKIGFADQQLKLIVAGGDFLQGTPVVDIKPYLPWCDSLPSSRGGYAHQPPGLKRPVVFADPAADQCDALASDQRPHLKALIAETLAADPRPAYQDQTEPLRTYGMHLYDLNIRWQVTATAVRVIAVEAQTKADRPKEPKSPS